MQTESRSLRMKRRRDIDRLHIKAHNRMLGGGGKKACISDEVNTVQAHNTRTAEKSEDEAVKYILCRYCSFFGRRGASIGRKKVSFCYYMRAPLSITVCQTATNELISIF